MRAFTECNNFGHPPFGLRANSWLNSPDTVQIPLSIRPNPVDAKIGKGNGDGLRRVGRSDLTLGANESQVGVTMPFTAFIFRSLFIEVAIFTTFTEYQYASSYMITNAILLFFFLGSMVSFNTSCQPCEYARTTLEASKRTCKAFIIAVRFGAVMGFPLAANGLLVLYIAINLFKLYHDDTWRDDVGKFKRNILKDNPKNPTFTADKVGANAGGIAGNYGSYATPSSAALIVASISAIGVSHNLTTLMYTPLASFVDIFIRWLTTLFATDFCEIKAVEEIKLALQRKWNILTASMTVGVTLVTWVSLLSFLTIFNFRMQKGVTNCTYYTSNAHNPVQDVANAYPTRVATRVIFSLALGYKSSIISNCAIAVSLTGATMYSIAVATLGLLDTIATGLAMDVYGSNSAHAGGMTEIAGMSHRICTMTDALDAAVMGIGVAIRFTILLSLAFPSTLMSCTSISTGFVTPKSYRRCSIDTRSPTLLRDFSVAVALNA
ncbi:hypothetical protein Nepgr_023542 [Nepenthes gracilis]|uniref:H(+)-exporting diphosphatase n=1 Tax=Nepenthes gracilis TaxID=150966 RepID=A0AAD3T2M8_NEPGR|nr:hypothetical protein Nepgr_023542 [Nepenthes gracilis]